MRHFIYNYAIKRLASFCNFCLVKSLLCVAVLCVSIPASAQIFGFTNPYYQGYSSPQVKTEPAKYKGGTEGMNKFIAKEFRPVRDQYPNEGRIVVACVIGEKGRIVETRVLYSLGDAFDKEALRVIKKLKFKPAMQGKKKIKSRIDIAFPIKHGRVSFSTLKTVDV